MGDMHLTRELLLAVMAGVVPPSVVAQVGLDHLMNLCPHCRAEVTAFLQERPTASKTAHVPSLDAVSAVLDRHVSDFHERRKRAVKDFEALMKLPVEERVRRLRRSRSRFRGREFVHLLIAESRRQVTADPATAFHLAELARVVIQYSPARLGTMELMALATAYMANACRAAGDLVGADQHFAHVRYLVTNQGVADTEVLARIDHLEGSLRMDQRRYGEAEELLTRAAMLFRVAGESTEVARVLTTLGYMQFQAESYHQGIETTRLALQQLPPDSTEHWLYLCARYNLARFLTELKRYEEALEILKADEAIFRKFPQPWTQLRLTWLQGKIAAGLGEDDAAERAFLAARDGFIQQRIPYDAAMVTLEDLALLYLRGGRTADVKRMAEEVWPIFQTQNLHEHALAALRLFYEAARQERLTAGLVRHYAAHIREVAANRHHSPT